MIELYERLCTGLTSTVALGCTYNLVRQSSGDQNTLTKPEGLIQIFLKRTYLTTLFSFTGFSYQADFIVLLRSSP